MVWVIVLWKPLGVMIALSGPITANKYQATSQDPMMQTHFPDDGLIFTELTSL